MQALEPAQPDAAGERILLAAARQVTEARAAARTERFLPSWVWKLSATAAAVLIVGGVSYRILWPQQALQAPDRASAIHEPAAVSSPTVANGPPPAAPAFKPLPSDVAPSASARSAPALQPAPSAVAAKPQQAAKAAATGGAQDAAGPVAEERLAPHMAKKELALAAPKPRAEVVRSKAAGDAAPSRDEEKLARVEPAAPTPSVARAAPASVAPPPPPSSPAPVGDNFALRATPEGAVAKSKRASAVGAKEARKADAVDAEEAQNAVAGSMASSAGATEADGSSAPPGRPLAERHRIAAPEPGSTEETDALARSIDERRRAGQLAAVAIAPCPGQGEVERRFYRDHGRIVIYQHRELTSDGSVTEDRYYDRAGHLRLARITRIQAGRRTVERNYLDATGERTLSGDRIPGPGEPDPEAVLRSSTPCADGP
jgi:hypothetical protein